MIKAMETMIKSYRMLILPKIGFKPINGNWTKGKLSIKFENLPTMNEVEFLDLIFKAVN